MITVAKSCDGTTATVTGDKVEMMMFFCIWQSHMWPDWIHASTKHAEALRQHKFVVQSIRDDGEIRLHDARRDFEDACAFAIGRCRLLGIDVQA